MSKDQSKKDINPYIPKYITTKPWYKQAANENGLSSTSDYLSHQRNTEEIVDYSSPRSGSGIKDEFEIKGSVRIKKNEDYDSKRDRWYGYEVNEWDEIIKNWNLINRRKIDKRAHADDSDNDTDYELELVELGLSAKDIKTNLKEDPMEKMIRDRLDVPTYISNINSGEKIKYDPKSRLTKDLAKGIINDDNLFVRQLDEEARDLKHLQKFAWEENEKYQQLRQREELAKKLNNLGKPNQDDYNDYSLNLDLNIEANPTLMNLKLKQFQQEQRDIKRSKKNELLNKYGGDEFLSKSKDLGKLKELRQNNGRSNYDKIKDMNNLMRSKYKEDDVSLNHSSIFGSYYFNGQWGYKCCKQIERNVYCNRA